MNYLNESMNMLKRWVNFSLSELYVCPDRPDLMCYGSGYNGWGMQAHQKAMAAFTTIATDKNVDYTEMTATREQLLEYSLKMLRFMLESHIEGTYQCLEGEKWGHTWISVLGTERALHAVLKLKPYLTEADNALLKKVMLSEAQWLLDEYDVCAGPEAKNGNNKPESNIWNGAFLYHVAAMYPECENAAAYREKAISFMVNGISVPDDKYSGIKYNGKSVSELYVGNNFYDSYALDHHGYLNVGYMVICISNLAIYYYNCKRMGVPIPEVLYHHAKDLWRLIRMLTDRDGRLLRVGGDTRFRYCYCQDYLLPALMFASEAFDDGEAGILIGRLVHLILVEFTSNGDGSFLSDRCAGLGKVSPTYYTRLESDKAVVLSMLIDWSDLFQKGSGVVEPLRSWLAPSHGACAIKGERRFASWSFYGAEGMTGLCLPKECGNMAEWYNNLAAEIMGSGAVNETEVMTHRETEFDGGFLVTGEVNRISRKFLEEQEVKDKAIARQQLVFAALPDDMTTVILQYAVIPKRTYIQSVKGINYNMPNDVYNGFKRTYFYEDGKIEAEHFGGRENLTDLKSRWINIDNKLGIVTGYDNKTLSLYRPGKRQITIKRPGHQDNLQNSYTEHLSCDVIATDVCLSPKWRNQGDVVLDTSALLFAGCSAEETKKKAHTQSKGIYVENDAFTRSVIVDGNDNYTYAVIYNLENCEKFLSVKGNREIENVVTGEVIGGKVKITAKTAILLRCMSRNSSGVR